VFPEYAFRDGEGNPPTVRLLQVDSATLANNTALNTVQEVVVNNRPVAAENPTALAPVSFVAELGNISKLVFVW
jgi:hypothetical protein